MPAFVKWHKVAILGLIRPAGMDVAAVTDDGKQQGFVGYFGVLPAA